MKKIYYLSTCDTCKRIINELDLKENGFVFQDIKTEKISPKQIEEMKDYSGTYAALFSKIARKYKLLENKLLSEAQMKTLILEEHTFLKRPVILVNKKIFIGNSSKTIEEIKLLL